MDEIVGKHQHGRRAMIDAFVELSTLARRAGVTEDEITPVHGRFFNGNVQAKRAFNIRCCSPRPGAPKQGRVMRPPNCPPQS